MNVSAPANLTGINRLRLWLKQSQQPLPRLLFRLIKTTRGIELVAPSWLMRPCYNLYCLLHGSLATISRILIWTPLFKGRLSQVGRHLYLYSGLPYICGPLQICIGNNCRISGQTTFSGRTSAEQIPQLTIGDNVDIGWTTTIAVGSQVLIGDNTRIAGGCLLAGYPGHPFDPVARAKGEPDTDRQVGDIRIEDDVWLATGVTVIAGVTIGHGTIVATGSVVTHNLPPMVLAAGVPARIIRNIDIDSYARGGD